MRQGFWEESIGNFSKDAKSWGSRSNQVSFQSIRIFLG